MPDAFSAAGPLPRRLFYYNAGFLRQSRLRRILDLTGHQLCLGRPGPQDGVVVWGRSPYAHRGEAVAARAHVPLIRVEDAFLRSVRPGRMGDPPIGLMIDGSGVHFDSAKPSRLEQILAGDPLDNSDLLDRARTGIARLQFLDLSKYNIHSRVPPPDAGYVLVVDQTRGDASIRHASASATSFAEMLVLAQTEHPTARIVIKTHPETQSGHRPGHFTTKDATDRISLCTAPVSPWALLDGAIAVYTVSSQLGFEAILAGHRPTVLGQPFYIGWGLTDDRQPLPRRKRSLTKTQLFAAALILAPIWYDPCRDRLCSFEQAVDQLEAETRAYREDAKGHIATAMRLWKRGRLQDFFGREKAVRFITDPGQAAKTAVATHRTLLIWAAKAPPNLKATRVEDGFLRSRGLGADLIPPLSLVTDDLGIYYDPSRKSRLEHLILAPLPPGGAARAEALTQSLITQRITKYNLAGHLPALPPGHRILVPGQVEDDASIRLGTTQIRTNLALLQVVRAANPQAILIYKPHPDVESGLRPGAVPDAPADIIATRADPVALIDACDEVWTMTSLLGFEALLRKKKVTCLGAPFYAGWGLTTDLGTIPDRRHHAADGHPLPRPTLAHLVHATLIAYPRYYDPVSKRPCPPEVAVHRLATGTIPKPGTILRLLAKAQGTLASSATLWR
ncbi:MAG: capsular polysaccharide biosynthesis protein [Candidatus Saccharibacteria bacterium]|nr:capsular polysaccharide biosynthesis protein [Pseudorhodobacter sp.]